MDKKNSFAIQFRTETINDYDQLFADFIVDGKSFFDQFRKYDVIPSLGWGIKEYQDEMVSYFLMQKPHPLLWYRVPVLVCSHCGDLECGFISAKLERIGNTIVWKDFYKNDYEKKINLMPHCFDFQNYKEAILSTFK